MIALSLVLFWVGRRRESPFPRAADAAFLTSATSNWEFSKADPTANIVGFLYRVGGNGPWRHMVSHGQVLTRVADIVVFGRA